MAIDSIGRNTTASHIRGATKKYKRAFIVEINNTPVFSEADALAAFAAARSDDTLSELTVVLAPERAPSMKDMHEPYAFGIGQIRIISALIHGIGKDENAGNLDGVSDDEINLLIAALSNTVLATDAERSLGSFTRRKLRRLESWPKWKCAEADQLNEMDRQGMYGEPCLPPKGAIILRQHWMYTIKGDGRRKARNCCDGSRRAAPRLRATAQTYASCV